MLRAVRRRVAVYRVYRQSRGLWDAYAAQSSGKAATTTTTTTGTASVPPDAVQLLDAFLLDFLASFDRLNQPRLLHRIYGDSFLPSVLEALILFVSQNGSSSDTREVVERALSVSVLILQDPIHSSQAALNSTLIGRILSLLETVSDKALQGLVLQIITGLCTNPESRLEIARLDGFRKMLILLGSGDDDLSHQILRTLRVFLDAESDNQSILEKAALQFPNDNAEDADTASQLVGRLQSNDRNVSSVESASAKANNANSQSRPGTWSRSRTRDAQDADHKRPSLTRSKSLINLNLTNLVRFPAELGMIALHGVRGGSWKEAEQLEALSSEWPQSLPSYAIHSPPLRVDIEQQVARLSQLRNDTSSGTSSAPSVRIMMTTQGALEHLTKSLADAPVLMQLELLRTISKLLLRNVATQREFTRIQGYSSLSRLLSQVEKQAGETSVSRFLAIIVCMVLDGHPDHLITNVIAFQWMMSLVISPGCDPLAAIGPAVTSAAILSLTDVVALNPLNAVAFMDYVPLLMTARNTLRLATLDELLLQIGYALVLHNSNVLQEFVTVFDGDSQFDNASHKVILKLLLQSRDCRAPRSPCMPTLIGAIGRLTHHLSHGDLEGPMFPTLLHLLWLAAVNGGSFTTDDERVLDQLPSSLDLDEALDLLFVIISRGLPASVIGLPFKLLGFLTQTSAVYSSQTASRHGQHADREQFNNSGFRLLLRLLRDHPFEVLKVLSGLLCGQFQTESGTAIEIRTWLQHEFNACGGISELVEVLLNEPTASDEDLVCCLLFALQCAIAGCPECKLSLEQEIRSTSNWSKLVSSSSRASSYLFDLVLELATEIALPDTEACHTHHPVGSECLERTPSRLTWTPNDFDVSALNMDKTHTASPIFGPVSCRELWALLCEDLDGLRPTSPVHGHPTEPRGASLPPFSNGDRQVGHISPSRDHSRERISRMKRMLRPKTNAPLLCLQLCASSRDGTVQASVLNHILSLIRGNPTNKKVLSELDAVSLLLQTWRSFRLDIVDVRISFLSLLAGLGRYSISPQQIRLMFDLATEAMMNTHPPEYDDTLQMQILDVIASLASRRHPEQYFNFNLALPTVRSSSIISSTVSRFPLSKVGYTLVLWFRLSDFVAEETILFTWMQGDAALFEVLFKLTPRERAMDNRSLCIRAGNHGTFMFDHSRSNTVVPSVWHHIALTHSRSGATIVLDGDTIGRFATIGYPSVASKRDLLHAWVGGPNFVGQFSPVYVLDGILDEVSIRALYSLGTLGALPSVYESKCVLRVHPEDAASPELTRLSSSVSVDAATVRARVASLSPSPPPSTAAPTSLSNIVSPATTFGFVESTSISAVLTRSQSSSLPLSSTNSSAVNSSGSLSIPPQVSTHLTLSIRSAMNCPGVGGLFMCIPFIGAVRPGNNGSRLAALRILAALLDRSPASVTQFESELGFEILLHCLGPAHLSMDILGTILDMACGRGCGAPRQQLQVRPALLLLFDLLRHSTGPRTRNKVMSATADLLRDEDSSGLLDTWFGASGVVDLLEMLRLASRTDDTLHRSAHEASVPLLSSVLSILEQILLTCSGTVELEIILSFIIDNTPAEPLLEERAALAELLCQCFQARESLLASVPISLLFPMLASSSRTLRLHSIHVLALLFRHHARNKATFLKMHGFDIMLRLLAKHQPLDEATCDAIFDLALDRFRMPVRPASPSVSPKRSRVSNLEEAPTVLHHPEAIRLLLELLRLASSWHTLHLRYIERIDVLIESRSNLNVLLQEPWLHWARQYLEGIGRHHSLEQASTGLSASFSKIKGDLLNFPDNESVSSSSAVSSRGGGVRSDDGSGERMRSRLISRFVRVIQKILVRDLSWHAGRQSCLTTLLTMVEATEFIVLLIDRALAFFEKCPRIDDADATCLLRNLSRLFESIDELVGPGKWSIRLIHLINLLASQNTSDVRTRMKQVGMFDMRDHLLLLFCQQPCSPADRFVALSQLPLDSVALDAKFRQSNGLLYLVRWFTTDDMPATSPLRNLLVEVLRRRISTHVEARRDLEKAVGDSEICQRLFETSISDADFSAWFLDGARDAQRSAIFARVEKTLSLAEVNSRRQADRAVEKREKRIRARLDSLGKAAAVSERAVQDALERCEQLTEKYKRTYASHCSRSQEARAMRIECGSKAYAAKCASLEFARSQIISSPDDHSTSPETVPLICALCGVQWPDTWELICHVRLDHWLEEVPPSGGAPNPAPPTDASARTEP
ncbi:NTF2 domain-containing protein [Plasmodiophora brassicae]